MKGQTRRMITDMKLESHRFENIGEEYKSAVLSNGLRVLTVEKPGFAGKYAAFAVKYGGADIRFRLDGEMKDTPAGIAHYLEHKMFDMPDGSNALSSMTANGAEANAYTSSDMTCYYFQCTDRFYDNLRSLLGFVTTPYFTEETVEKERGIITQEIMMGRDNPDRIVFYNLLGMLYRHHPLRQDVAGTVESISHITAETLYSCHKTFYCPGNMVLCVEGDVKAEDVVSAAEAALKDWAPSSVPESDYGEDDGVMPYEVRMEESVPISEKQFIAGAKGPSASGDFTRQQIVGRLALQILFGRSSAFFNRLYAEGTINRSFFWDLDRSAGTTVILFGGETPDPDRVVEEIKRTVRNAVDNGIDKALFERIKKSSLGASLRLFDDFDSVCTGLAEGIFDGFCIFETPEMLESVTVEECLEFLTEYLPEDHIAVSIITPCEEKEAISDV